MMDKAEPDFYLSANGEYLPLREPRACWAGKRLRDDRRDDHMQIEIDPALLGQPFGLADDIRELVISARWDGLSLFPITSWPLAVYISRILDRSILESGYFRKDQVELIAWGMIYKTKEEIRL